MTLALGSPVHVVQELIRGLVMNRQQPSAWELIDQVESTCGLEARWLVRAAMLHLAEAPDSPLPSPPLTRANRDYLRALLGSQDLANALNGSDRPKRQVQSTIDQLVLKAAQYRQSAGYREMLDFMANFRDYAPFNNMLVRVQNPSCSFFATAIDWQRRFGRQLKEDAKPMLILAPMHPVMLVYELDQTEGPPLPEELQSFARVDGEWNPEWLERTSANASRDQISVEFKDLSSTNAGRAQLSYAPDGSRKLRIVVHAGLEAPARYATLCHELAHIYLGHLGTGPDNWWPARGNLAHDAIEFEAEAAAYVATGRLGLSAASAEYLSAYTGATGIPSGVSLDYIAKVSGHLERMARETLPPRRQRAQATLNLAVSENAND